MDKFHFTKWEKIFLVLAFLVILMLFVSSSMTYQQQELHEGVMNKRFGWLENIVAGWNFTYGGRVHNVQVDGRAGLAQFVLRKMAHFGSYFLLGGFGYLGMRRIFKIIVLIIGHGVAHIGLLDAIDGGQEETPVLVG